MTLCECGCGQEVKSGNRFARGHNSGHKMPSPRFVAEEDRFIPGTGIDRITTIKEMGYDPIDLKHSTRKKFWAICLECGIGRWISKYYDLCIKCSRKGERNPMFGKKHSSEQITNLKAKSAEYWADEDNRLVQSNRLLQHFIDNPEAGHDQSERMKTSTSAKASQVRQEGGNDIINHHFIYDHAHPENHVIEITRSEHANLHHWMKRGGLEVPHFNITAYNKNVFKGRKQYD